MEHGKKTGLYIQMKEYMSPNSKKIKKKILQENHDSADVGHPGQQKMLDFD